MVTMITLNSPEGANLWSCEFPIKGTMMVGIK